MHSSQTTFLKAWHRRLAAILAVASVLLFAIATTHAASTQRHHQPAPAPLTADGIAPAAPAGPHGPIELTCRAGRARVAAPDGPAGPQGPVATACGPTAQH